jgi:hypothetical protein
MLIGLCGAELVGPSTVGASEGFLGWVAYLGAANAGGWGWIGGRVESELSGVLDLSLCLLFPLHSLLFFALALTSLSSPLSPPSARTQRHPALLHRQGVRLERLLLNAGCGVRPGAAAALPNDAAQELCAARGGPGREGGQGGIALCPTRRYNNTCRQAGKAKTNKNNNNARGRGSAQHPSSCR